MYEKREEEHGWLLDLYRRWNIRTPETAEFIARRYIERFIGCVENLTNPNCRMNYRQKRREVRKMLKNERVAKSLRLAKPRSFYMKVMLIPVRMRNVTLLLLEASVITFVKTKNTRLFARLKAGGKKFCFYQGLMIFCGFFCFLFWQAAFFLQKMPEGIFFRKAFLNGYLLLFAVF